jgi:hypothetical protein
MAIIVERSATKVTIQSDEIRAYIVVFRREGEVLAEPVFFEGNRPASDLATMAAIIARALFEIKAMQTGPATRYERDVEI